MSLYVVRLNLMVKRIRWNDAEMLNPVQLKQALIDLAEYGFVVLESEDDADQVQAEYPIETDKIGIPHGWWVCEKTKKEMIENVRSIGRLEV